MGINLKDFERKKFVGFLIKEMFAERTGNC